MGYRSDIAFAIETDKSVDELYALLKLALPNKPSNEPFTKTEEVVDAFRDIVGRMRVYRDRNRITFYANQWKWYGDCEQAYKHIVEICETYDTEIAIRFVRIGESSDDCEEETVGEGWELDYPQLVRSMDISEEFKEEGTENVEHAE